MKKRYSKEFKIGITAIICAAIMIFGINYLKGVNIFKPDNYYYIKMQNVQGLNNSAPVYIDGFKVGLIRDMIFDFNDPGKILVEISVDKQMRIPSGSKIEMSTDLLGTASFDIIVNRESSSYYNIGDTIQGSVSSGLKENITENMLPKIENMLPKIDSILTGLNVVINDPKLRETMHSVNGLAANLETSSRLLNNVLKNDLPQITANLKSMTGNFAEISRDINNIDFEELYASVDKTLANVNKIAEDISSENGTVGLLLRDPSLYNNLNSTVAHADSLMIDLKKNPKRYVHFSVLGRK